MATPGLMVLARLARWMKRPFTETGFALAIAFNNTVALSTN